MSYAKIFYSSLAGLRFTAALAILLLVVSTRSLILSLIVIMLLALCIRLLDGCWKSLFHMLKLLRWFVIPILLLHLIFSHGELILPSTVMPFTWQGLQQGLWLSVHLSTIFIAAMLMFRALNRVEWNRLILSLPFVGRKLVVYLIMMEPVRSQMSNGLKLLKQQWLLRRDWRAFPVLVLASFSFALSGFTVYAHSLWLRWPVSLNTPVLDISVPARHRQVMNLACLAVLILAGSMMIV